jgi:outer membrane protein assembly factor BamE
MNSAFYRFPAVLLALAAALLPACKSVDVTRLPGVTPYRMVIQQGNFISQEMVSQLKPGMTKEQVRFVLGTPLVTDIFHADRWDYVFFRELPDGKKEQRNLSVVFEKDKLARVLGDLMPADGTPPKASGFEPLVKPEAKPEAKPAAAAKPPAKPEAAEAAPAAAAPAAAEAAKPAATGQNWSTASEQLESQPAAAPVAKEEEQKPTEAKKEPGFLDRLREKIGL